MFRALKVKRSAGIRVTRQVHAVIAQGNAARGRSDWSAAARHYDAALALDPSLTHVWIQIGHMYKEDRVWERAVFAYAQAAKLAPSDPSVIGWLFEIAGRLGDDERHRVTTVLRTNFPAAVFHQPPPPRAKADGREIVFDVSDLVSYFARARVPTGIQRVQIEVIRALTTDRVPPRICCAIEGRDIWVEIPIAVFDRITNIATGGERYSAREWVEALASLQLSLLLGDAIVFGLNAALLNLGTSWWLQNYFLQVRNAQVDSELEYIPFVHDLIPIKVPEHCVGGLVEDFVFWATSVFGHARRFLVNSEATKRDLLIVARELGHNVVPNAVTVVPLDARFAKPDSPVDAAATLRRFGLARQPFVLFVSTIESRKDHVAALRVWQRLLERYGAAAPKLVCVGNDGWLNENFYTLLAADVGLQAHVVLLTKISDCELGLLYEQCLFTVYPSTYEGWGLPITEALSYGKPVVAANNSSLPEAGGTLALYFEPGDLDQFTNLVERLGFDDAYRAQVSERIAREYRPRDWGQVARQIIDFAVIPALPAIASRQVAVGRWYDLSRSREREIWPGSGSAEIFRVGRGWADVDSKGAWLRSDRATLSFDLPDSGTFDLALRVMARTGLDYQVALDGRVIDTGTIKRGAQRWVIHRFAGLQRPVCIDLSCRPMGPTEPVPLTRVLCVTGFAVNAADDESRYAFLEAVTLRRLDRIKAFRRPGDGRDRDAVAVQ